MAERIYTLCEEDNVVHVRKLEKTYTITLCGVDSIAPGTDDIFLSLNEISQTRVTCLECLKILQNNTLREPRSHCV